MGSPTARRGIYFRHLVVCPGGGFQRATPHPPACNSRLPRPYMRYRGLSHCSQEPQERREQFFQAWHEAALPLRHAPGFRSTRLHESLDPQAKYRFVKVAEWESPRTSRQL